MATPPQRPKIPLIPLAPRTFMVSALGDHDSMEKPQEEFFVSIEKLRENQRRESLEGRSGEAGGSPWRSVPIFGVSNSSSVGGRPLPKDDFLTSPRTPSTSPRHRMRSPMMSASMPNLFTSSFRSSDQRAASQKSPTSPRKISPRNPLLTVTLQDVQKSSEAVIDVQHPSVFSPRKRAVTNPTKVKSRVKIMSPREWKNDSLSGQAVKWTDYTGPARNDSMIFVFPHAYNCEFGGEFKNFEHPMFDLSNQRTDQIRHFLEKVSQDVFVATHKHLGPIVICIEDTMVNPAALIFHKEGIKFDTLPNTIKYTGDRVNELEHLLKKLTASTDSIVAARRKSETDIIPRRRFFKKIEKANQSKFKESLLKVVDVVFPERVKVGLLRMPEGKCYEDELFKVDSVSDEFVKFLDQISDQGSNLNGRFLAHHDENEVMFHVGPYISLSSERFISSDMVVVVFKEGGPDDIFMPSNKITHKTQIYIVVAPVKRGGTTKYKVQVASKLRVDPFPPFLPDEAIFAAGPAFKDFILSKVIHGTRAGQRASVQSAKALEVALNGAIEPFCPTF